MNDLKNAMNYPHFARIMRSENALPSDEADYRLLTRKAAEAYIEGRNNKTLNNEIRQFQRWFSAPVKIRQLFADLPSYARYEASSLDMAVARVLYDAQKKACAGTDISPLRPWDKIAVQTGIAAIDAKPVDLTVAGIRALRLALNQVYGFDLSRFDLDFFPLQKNWNPRSSLFGRLDATIRRGQTEYKKGNTIYLAQNACWRAGFDFEEPNIPKDYEFEKIHEIAAVAKSSYIREEDLAGVINAFVTSIVGVVGGGIEA